MKFCLRNLLTAYEYLVCCLGSLWVGLFFLLWSLLALVLHPLLPARLGRALGRLAIMAVFRLTLAALTLSGRFHFDLRELDALRKDKSLIIASNHPSLWDVVLIASRLPDVACIMKADILSNIFLGGGARLARYISNAPPRQMVMQAVQNLQRGSHLLLFPEGTRTVQRPIGPLKGSIGVIACRAKTPIQTVLIETDSPFLSKQWPLFKKPRLPMHYRVRLGKRFPPPENGAAFMAELAQYFASQLAVPVSPPGPAAAADAS
ncbi:1-acyl-sn-glycerol-3-phosphate acyltransferase [Herminiimonas sp. CN]|uniref:lysophospholipid acyltransferase family protein n=1 Tax=Herminiimonas sp. CN TaxID=1349818 RepID=UPI000473C56F|nr:lysophospholipid acyltransferase family protein [Herminiimonas sp. CN]